MTKPQFPIVIFDSHCLLCNKSLDILIKLDKKRVLRYSTIDGKFAKILDIDREIDSIILYEDGKLYYKSTAILKIARSLGGIGILASIFYIIPRFMRDFIYDTIAKYRYHIFGKTEGCRMSNKGDEVLFLD